MITTINEFKQYIKESIDSNIPKALSDINERRPNRMKKPLTTDGNWFELCRAGQPMNKYCVYIQDEAEEICQDKYGKERGTKIWMDSINAPQRGAMFKLADDIMKEKSYLCNQLNLRPSTYWDYSYFALWKMWMDKIGASYNIDSDEVVAQRLADKENARIAAEQEAREQRNEQTKQQAINTVNDIKTKYADLNMNLVADTKDKERIINIFNNNRSSVRTQIEKMSNSITDKNKAIKRGIAGLDYIIENPNKYIYGYDIETFFKRARNL